MTGPSRGFVLPAVLFAVVLLAALAAGGFFAALQEQRAGANVQSLVRARAAAEAGVWFAVANWDPVALDSLAVGAAAPVAPPPLAGLSLDLLVRRLSDFLFLVQARARAPGGADAGTQVVVRLPSGRPIAALTARGLGPGLAGVASGGGRPPPGWRCAPEDSVSDVQLLPGASDSTLFRVSGRDWATLASWAASVRPGGDSLGVRYEPADALLSGVSGMGTLVVAGDLTIRAGARFTGLILVHGNVFMEGPGVVINGGMVASQVYAANGYTASAPAVFHSSCAVDLALRSRASPEPLPGLNPTAIF